MTHIAPPSGSYGALTDYPRLDPLRLAAVHATGLLDSEVEEVFDRLTRLAVRLVRVPAAFISLVDENRDFYKSACGFGEPLATTRELTGLTFCHYTIQRTEPLVIPDTAGDPRYRDVPTVKTLGVAAYVGVPLVIDGQTIGAFCAIDMVPRAWTPDDVEVLVELAASAQREIVVRAGAAATARLADELRESNAQLSEQTTELEMQAEELAVIAEELQERNELAESVAEALKESEARYRTMAESVPVQVWTATPDGNFDFVNGQAARFFSTTKEGLLGRGWMHFIHPDDRADVAGRWETALLVGQPFQADLRLRNGATDEYHWHLTRALPMRDSSDAIVGWSGSNTDVQAERAARAEAEAANRGKSEFLAAMSHELRTPLNAIGGYAELLQLGVKGSVTDDQRDYLDRVRRAQRHLLGLINGILNYAKVDAGVVQFADEPMSMNELLATCESLTLPQVRAKGLNFQFASCRPDLLARGDDEKAQQILLNLLSNAIKFTDSGGRISIECGHEAPDRIFIRVIDTGRGIPARHLSRLFQPFVQVDAELTRLNEGTGLGLAISRELARGMGGDITVESTEGAGSSFTLTLRAADPV